MSLAEILVLILGFIFFCLGQHVANKAEAEAKKRAAGGER